MDLIFIESIAVDHGKVRLLAYHQARMDRTYAHFFHAKNPHSIVELTDRLPSDKRYKFRIVYGKDHLMTEYHVYRRHSIRSLQVVEVSEFNYGYKYADRSQLDELYQRRGRNDDVIITINRQITDSYYANLAFWDGQNWHTPSNPLLHGTKRQFLIDQGNLLVSEIGIGDLHRFSKVSLINAMINLGEVEVDTGAIEIPYGL